MLNSHRVSTFSIITDERVERLAHTSLGDEVENMDREYREWKRNRNLRR